MSAPLPSWMRWGFGGTFLLVGACTLASSLHARSSAAPAGVAGERLSLAGVPVGGKSSADVRLVAQELAARVLAVPVVVTYEKLSEQTTPGRLGVTAEVKAAVDAVFAASEEPESLLERIRLKFTGPDAKDIPLPLQVTEEGLRRGLLRFAVRMGTEPRDARLTKVAGKFRITEGQPGRELDRGALARELEARLTAPDFRERLAGSLLQPVSRSEWLKGQEPIRVPAATRVAEPRITRAHLKPITSRLASYSTSLGRSSRNRVHNIQLACKPVDGLVLLPGDVFSYNEVVGPRVPSAGYREAPVIIRGELQPGTGGGICQVSSTLYNAALLADLEIVRRSHHAFPVSYVPAGRDATVVDGSIDFKFRNSLKHPIALDAKVGGGKVHLHVYGHPDDRKEVEVLLSGHRRVAAGTRTVQDPKLPRGRRVVEREPRSGRRVTVTRVVKKGGAVVRQEVVSRDYYRPFSGLVRVGTAGTPLQEAAPGMAPGSPPPSPGAASAPAGAALAPGG